MNGLESSQDHARTTGSTDDGETRRGFIQRARGAAAVPVVIALSMAWSRDVKANPY